MKTFKKIAVISFILVLLSGCETYKDYDIEYSPVYPLCGEWLVRFTNTSVNPNTTSNLIVLSTFNTADNSTTQMWIRAASTSSTYMGRFDGKINCDVTALSFNGENVANTFYTAETVPTFTLTNGTIVIDGYDTATGGKSDKISFTFTDSRKPGTVYTVSGFRRTRWLEDEV